MVGEVVTPFDGQNKVGRPLSQRLYLGGAAVCVLAIILLVWFQLLGISDVFFGFAAGTFASAFAVQSTEGKKEVTKVG